jgi:hypothetical protein
LIPSPPGELPGLPKSKSKRQGLMMPIGSVAIGSSLNGIDFQFWQFLTISAILAILIRAFRCKSAAIQAAEYPVAMAAL